MISHRSQCLWQGHSSAPDINTLCFQSSFRPFAPKYPEPLIAVPLCKEQRCLAFRRALQKSSNSSWLVTIPQTSRCKTKETKDSRCSLHAENTLGKETKQYLYTFPQCNRSLSVIGPWGPFCCSVGSALLLKLVMWLSSRWNLFNWRDPCETTLVHTTHAVAWWQILYKNLQLPSVGSWGFTAMLYIPERLE